MTAADLAAGAVAGDAHLGPEVVDIGREAIAAVADTEGSIGTRD